jgi:hypothetical protein
METCSRDNVALAMKVVTKPGDNISSEAEFA